MKSFISKAKSKDAKIKSILKFVKQDLNITSRLYDITTGSSSITARVERTQSQRNKNEVTRTVTVYYKILDNTIEYEYYFV